MSRDACIELAKTLGVDAEVLLEQWAERAAIREVDAGFSREEAERLALEDVRLAHRKGPQAAPSQADAKKSRSSL